MRTLAAVCWVVWASIAGAASPIAWVPMGEPGSGGTIVSCSVDPRNASRILIGGDMLGVGRSIDGGKSWQATTGFSCFEDGSFTWHPTEPDTVWVGTASGPYVSRDGGATWTARRDGFPPPASFGRSAPVEKVMFDPGQPGRMLAIGGSSRHWDCGPRPAWGAVWESLDDGLHWRKLTTVTADGSNDKPDAKGVNLWQAEWLPAEHKGRPGWIYGVADSAGLVFSDDGGKSWALVKGTGLPQGAKVGRIAVTSHDPELLWTSVSNTGRKPGGVFKSTDGGRSWVEKSDGLAKFDGGGENLVSRYESICVSPVDPNRLYVCDTAWNGGVIYQSTDGGDHWRAAASKGNIGQKEVVRKDATAAPFRIETAFFAGAAMSGSTFDPNDPRTAYFYNTEFLLTTRDDGNTFHDLTSEKAGDGWRGRGFNGICTEHFGFNPYRKGQSVAQGMDAAKAWVSDDDLHSWHHTDNKPDPWFGGFDAGFAKDGTIFITCGQYAFRGVGRSTDGGKTWTTLEKPNGLPEMRYGGGRGSEGVYVDPDDSRMVWAVAEGKLFHSVDRGESWHAIRTGSRCHFIAADDDNHLYVTSDRNLYRVDRDDKLALMGGPKPAGRIHFVHGSLYVCSYEADRGGLWVFDRMRSWRRLNDDRQIMDVAVDPTDPSRIAVAENMMPIADVQHATGVWVSGDGGKSWSNENAGLAMTRGGAIAFDPFDSTRLVFGTFGRGFFVARWPTDYRPTGGKSYTSIPADEKFAAVDDSDGKPRAVHLRNGDMTDGAAVPTGWENKWGDVTIARDTTVFASAPASLRVTSTGKPGQASQSFDVVGGQTLTVSGKLKSAGKARVNFAIQSYDQTLHPVAFQQVGYAQNDSDWRAVEKTVTLPDGAVHAAVVLLVEGDGSGWLDDAMVK